jgi:hypothetical protein
MDLRYSLCRPAMYLAVTCHIPGRDLNPPAQHCLPADPA